MTPASSGPHFLFYWCVCVCLCFANSYQKAHSGVLTLRCPNTFEQTVNVNYTGFRPMTSQRVSVQLHYTLQSAHPGHSPRAPTYTTSYSLSS